MKLEKIVSDTTRKFKDTVNCGRAVPDYLRKQVDGIYEMETDFSHGISILLDGLIAERDHLKEIKRGRHHIQS